MNQPHRIAFAGFRHPHIFGLSTRAQNNPQCAIVAACEEDPAQRARLESEGTIPLTHSNFQQMLEETDASIIAIGDTYARRGALAIAALRAGKHILSDKPLCTRLEEFHEIAALATERGLSVGCQLDLVESDGIRRLKAAIASGVIGRLCTVTIGAQHPLRLGSRAAWYFEPGQHGGTINDIGIHVFDLIPWLSGQAWKNVPLATEWNAKAAEFPHFKDCAQFYAVTEGGISCYADVSYLAPDALGYDLPQYWRVTAHGTAGFAEVSYASPGIQIVTDQDTTVQAGAALEGPPGCYLQEFLEEISGRPVEGGITTPRVLAASRWALEAQARASAPSPQ
jgi:predicted dehydrogenase